ncbi:NUDIX domain-containing protein [Promicromonospora thailandica]|uniref:NTP pyrophosphohydrolase, NUDIX family n=1 Tax=Promicromonospora thailandica TaxID=765201 RepID=A0A9X2JW00_9MICO|nr:NUDIX domain-containing protein [Promicromonospora thailandica]MCP2265621.1 putative NTP pyrophosphohydrolase, NUDIX family [Promicromonospora thailandica]BFF21624.1 NUDIX domain-containing protein [Promicromonospora thailandica]
MATTSAGLLLYRRTPGGFEVLLGHMGGPFWARKDEGAWTVLKGELEPGEDPHAAALREAEEELGLELPPASVPDLALGEIRQRAGKVVHAWAREWPESGPDLSRVRSNTIEIEWPPRSGRRLEMPEIDRVAWFAPDDARRLAVRAQAELVDRLEDALGG